jgi:PPK2 family polyphosphate:nucleotide phosphotransferase
MKIDCRSFIVPHHVHRALHGRPTEVSPFYTSKKDFQHILARHVEQLDELQERLYASREHALLVIFQGMDTAGKDGTIRHVLSGVNPQGVQVSSFGRPSDAELRHEFLWRETLCLPERGRIGIFNRSYYEEVVVVRVHPELLRHEGVTSGGGARLWQERFESIIEFERHLHRNGTSVLKFYLHLSRDEQRRRLLARLDDPHKHWKFNPDDVEERRHWREYMNAYNACLSATSRSHAPWYIVPADDKRNARLIVSQAIIDALGALNLRYPRVDSARRRELRAIRRRLGRDTEA